MATPKLSNLIILGYVTSGDIEFSPEDSQVNVEMWTSSLEQAKFWANECKLRVRVLYAGPVINETLVD